MNRSGHPLKAMKVLLSCLLLVFANAHTVLFAALAIDSPGTGHFGKNEGPLSNNYGWIFTIGTSDLLVSGLGIWDDNGDGLVASHPVGIWDATGALVAQTVVPVGTQAPLVGQFRVQALSAPLPLPVGATFTIGAFYDGDDVFSGSYATPPSVSPAITAVVPRHNFSPVLSLPDRPPAPGAGPTPYVGPTFEFTPVPEPRVFVLSAGAVLLVAAWRRRVWPFRM